MRLFRSRLSLHHDRDREKEVRRMTRMWKPWALVPFACVLLAAPAPAADAPHVLTVLTVKVKGDQDAYLEKVKKFITAAKGAGGTTRVWRSSLAGSETGLIFIATEY